MMQREVDFNENNLLNAIKRLNEAIAQYKIAHRELKLAKKEYDDSENVIMPEIPEI